VAALEKPRTRSAGRAIGQILAVASAAACAARQYPVPMTATQLARYEEGSALVAYLGQPDADPGVCDLQTAGPFARVVDADGRRALDRGFREGRLPPGVWRDCMDRLLRTAPPETATSLQTDVLRDARDLLDDARLETDLASQGRLDAAAQLHRDRPAGVVADPAELAALASWLESGLAKGRFGPFGQRAASDLLATIGLERGRWRGSVVDLAALDGFLAGGDEATLRRCADRLPDAALREAARRSVIRIHILASPFPEVRLESRSVEELVARTGANPVSPHVHAPVRGLTDAGLAPVRSVLLEQHLREQTVRLAGSALVERSRPGLTAAVALRGALQVEMAGLSRPVTLCAPPQELDVSPCLAAGDVQLLSTLARVDDAGVVRLVESISESEAVALAGRRSLLVPIAVAGGPVATLEWRLAFRTPDDLELVGAEPAGEGPGLDVRVEVREPERLVYSVTAAGHQYQAVVEWAQAGAFRVISRGGRGRAGASGSSGTRGSSGLDGRSASCPSSSGQDGSRGGRGGRGGTGDDGGPGGRGREIRVTVSADEAVRARVLGVLQPTFLSQGGPGGEGGAGGGGGSGGRGGSGGSGTTCFKSDGSAKRLSGGTSGSSGLEGSSGSAGSPGPAGAPGRVTVQAGP